MSSPLVDVLAAIEGVLDAVGDVDAALRNAADARDRAARSYESVLLGSSAADADTVLSRCRYAQHQLQAAAEAVVAARQLLGVYRARLRGRDDAQPSIGSLAPNEPGPPATTSPPSTGEPPDHQATVRRELDRVGRTPKGAETTGAWIGADGRADPITSGTETPWFRRTRAILAAIDPRWTRLATHCEMQAVVRAHQENRREETPDRVVRHITLALSRAPCGADGVPQGSYTCDQKLSQIIVGLLPPGSTLTVIDPDETMWRYPKEGERR